jgi:hypothetical protein
MNKTYFVESEMCDRVGFQNESDRNEMALALYEEYIYFLTMHTKNWYGSEGVLSGIAKDASSNVRTWDAYESFDVPTQVAFWDVDGDHYIGGIAYGDEIICGCCGGVVEIAEVCEFAPEGIEPIVIYNEWVDLSGDILEADEANYFYDEEG